MYVQLLLFHKKRTVAKLVKNLAVCMEREVSSPR